MDRQHQADGLERRCEPDVPDARRGCAVGNARGFFGIARNAIGDLVKLGPAVLRSRGGFLLIGETLAKLGLKAIPVVGEILMLIDTIRFLGNNSKNIGKIFGEMVGWMWYHGLPMLRDAFIGVLKNIAWVISHPGQLLKNGWDWLVTSGKNLVSGVVEGVNSQKPPPKVTIPKGATGGKHGQVAMAGGAPVFNFHYHAAPGNDVQQKRAAEREHQRIANKVADILAKAGQVVHGGTVASPLHGSAFEIEGGVA